MKTREELEKIGNIVSDQIKFPREATPRYVSTPYTPQPPCQKKFFGRLQDLFITHDDVYATPPREGVYQWCKKPGFFSNQQPSPQEMESCIQKTYKLYAECEDESFRDFNAMRKSMK
jgi:hypothetical protein